MRFGARMAARGRAMRGGADVRRNLGLDWWVRTLPREDTEVERARRVEGLGAGARAFLGAVGARGALTRF